MAVLLAAIATSFLATFLIAPQVTASRPAWSVFLSLPWPLGLAVAWPLMSWRWGIVFSGLLFLFLGGYAFLDPSFKPYASLADMATTIVGIVLGTCLIAWIGGKIGRVSF